MALPVLVTVTALGAGWLLLSRERSSMAPGKDGASGASDRATGDAVVRDHGAEGVAGTPGEFSIHTKGGLEVAAMGFAEGGAAVDGADGIDPSTGAGGATGDGGARPGAASNATPSDVPAATVGKYQFGTLAQHGGISNYQQARALNATGPALGQVW